MTDLSSNINFSTAYSQSFKRVLLSNDLVHLGGPETTITIWADLIDSISFGYNFIPPELENDLDYIRKPIELLFLDNDLRLFPEHVLFTNEIERLDEIYLRLTMESPSWMRISRTYWFENRILKVAGPDYANFINAYLEKYGVKVDIQYIT